MLSRLFLCVFSVGKNDLAADPGNPADFPRQGIDAVVAGQSLEDAAKEHVELAKAIECWGIYQENKSGLFDLKG